MSTEAEIVVCILLILICFAFQLKFFIDANVVRKKQRNVFPENPYDALTLGKGDDGVTSVICANHDLCEEDFIDDVVVPINQYIEKNGSSAEYAVIKEMVSRTVDSLDDQISSLSPLPVYFGLAGTLVGIVAGVFGFMWGKALEFLMDYSTTESAKSGADGISNLMYGVALAMLTTLVGLIFSIWGSCKTKKSSVESVKRMNKLLTWVQSELLPGMGNNNLAKTFTILQRNLNRFNNNFAKNTEDFQSVLSDLGDNYVQQAEMLERQKELLAQVEKLNIGEMANANVRVLKELQASGEQLGALQQFLGNTTGYLENVKTLNENLEKHYDRTRLIENVGEYFMKERQQVEGRTAALSEVVSGIDGQLQKAFNDLLEHTEMEFGELSKLTTSQEAALMQAIDDQKEMLQKKLEEVPALIEELGQLPAIKGQLESLTGYGKQLSEQLAALLAANKELRMAVREGITANHVVPEQVPVKKTFEVSSEDESYGGNNGQRGWKKILWIGAGAIIVAYAAAVLLCLVRLVAG